MEAISMRNLKSCAISDEAIRASGLPDFQTCGNRDREFAIKYKEQYGPDVFRQILQSFCPSIYGHELVKGRFYPNNFFPAPSCIMSKL
jgi:DNA helicase MCM8